MRGNWYNEGCRGKGREMGEAEKGGGVMLHTDRSLLASHMITHTQVGICINMFYNIFTFFTSFPHTL